MTRTDTDAPPVLETVPTLRGRAQAQAPLAPFTWFRAGGPAELLVRPADADDLAAFLRDLPIDVPVQVIGACSNLIIRDGGLPGVTIKLARGFSAIEVEADGVVAGAAALDVTVSEHAAAAGLTGLEFLSGIPGTIGGAVTMNAGAYGGETAHAVDWVEVVTRSGEQRRMAAAALAFAYRHARLPPGAVVTRARLRAQPGEPALIAARMNEIRAAREASQPVRARTGGSTFRNPPGMKAWELIDAAGCRGLVQGGAMVSEKHCTFLINTGSATAADIEGLGEEVRRRVFEMSGVTLDWEIHRIGTPLPPAGEVEVRSTEGEGRSAGTVPLAPLPRRFASRPLPRARTARAGEVIAVLYGGPSAEREVSLASGRQVIAALREAGFTVKPIEVGDDLAAVIAALNPKPHAVFNALHGRFGEDGAIQGVLDWLGIPYTHSGVRASALAMDKAAAKAVFSASGLPVARGKVVPLNELESADPLPLPYVIKPVNEGSSVGVEIIRSGDNRRADIARAWRFGDRAMVEEYIPGRELTVGVMDTEALAVTEIIAEAGVFYDYESKYADGGSRHVIPAAVHPDIYARALEVATAAHRALGCRGATRCDFRYDDTQGEPGRLVLLEINTQPGMTPTSLLPEQAAYCGVSFPQLCAWMVENAACRA